MKEDKSTHRGLKRCRDQCIMHLSFVINPCWLGELPTHLRMQGQTLHAQFPVSVCVCLPQDHSEKNCVSR